MVLDKQLQILTIDDDANARLLIRRQLEHTFSDPDIVEISTLDELQHALRHDGFDLVITDYQLNWSDGLTILKHCKERWPHCPVIMFTATGSEEIAVEAMKAGLDDYILKSPKHLPRLSTSAQAALERFKHRQALEAAEKRYRTLFDKVPVGLFRATIEGQILDANLTLTHMLGYPNTESLLTKNLTELYVTIEDYRYWRLLLAHQGEANNKEMRLRRHNGDIIWVRKSVRAVWRDSEELLLCEGVVEDITERKQTERELAISQARQQAIFENTLNGIMVVDDERRLVDVNPAMCNLLGYERAELLTMHSAQITPDTITEDAYQAWCHFLEAGQMEGEFFLRHKDGSLIETEYRAVANILPGLHLAVHRDIRERKRSEAALRTSEARLRAIFNSGPQAIILIDPDYKIQTFNRLAWDNIRKIFGKSIQRGDSIHDYILPKNLGVFNRDFHSALQGKTVKLERRYWGLDNQAHWFEFIYSPVFEGGEVTGVCLSSTSIDDRKRMEEALVKSEKLYRAIIEDQTELICRFAEEGQLTFVNEAYHRYFGETAETLLYKGFLALVYPDDRDKVRRQIESLTPEQPVGTIENRAFRADGQVRWTQWHNRAIFDDRGHIIEYQSVGRDITEYKEMKESLEHRNLELTLLNRASQAFISTLDLDEILNSVLEEVKRSLDVVACSVWLVDSETGELVCRQVTDPQSEIVRGWRLAPGTGLGGWVVRHGESLNIPDVLESDRHFKGVDQETGLPLRSILTVPLQTKSGVTGVLQMVDAKVNRFDETDQRLGEALAVLAAGAIENAQLYEQAQRDAETKAIMLNEINHRVKNNLAAIIGLLYAERRHAGMENEDTYQMIMKSLINRVQGLATVHSLLSESGWAPLPLSELARQIIQTSLRALLPGKQVLVNVSASSVRVLPRQAHSLALIINELTTNTLKYALSEQDVVTISVDIAVDTETDAPVSIVIFEFRDDGPGYPPDVLHQEKHDVGLYMIKSIAKTDLRGALTLNNDNGAVTILSFKLLD